jgi:hypothetical protein
VSLCLRVKKLCVFAPLRALRETKKVQEVGNSRLLMLVFSPIIKEGEFA